MVTFALSPDGRARYSSSSYTNGDGKTSSPKRLHGRRSSVPSNDLRFAR